MLLYVRFNVYRLINDFKFGNFYILFTARFKF